LLVVVAVAAAIAGAQAGSASPRSGEAGSAAKLSPPVIREPFTPLPCSGQPNARNTLQQEGCAEQQILRTDGQINALAKSVFSLLPDSAARRRFDKASSAWLAYRRADCLSVSDVFEGGTQAPVLYALCEAARNAQRLKDLRAFKRDLTPP
jgi:uncharacterized protein YecT (DUF1311 family)